MAPSPTRRPSWRRATLRARPRGDWLPPVAGWLTAVAGAINVCSAVTPEMPARLHELATAAPAEVVVGAHALTLPAGVALLATSIFLTRRRRRAHRLAVVLLTALGALNLLKGLDVEEAMISWALAGLLVWGRQAFDVVHDEEALPRMLRRAALVATGAGTIAVAVVAAAAHWATPELTAPLVLREAIGLLTLTGGPVSFTGWASWLPGELGLLGMSAGVLIASLLLRPRVLRHTPCEASERAAELVHAHGGDTLSFFKLRADLQRTFSSDGRAFVAYRVESGVLLMSGDPVGPADAVPGLLADVAALAAERGLRIGVVGASEEFADFGCAAGLRRFYIGDEAIVDTSAFTLEGKRIKKVRQATHRLKRSGYSVEVRRVGELDARELASLERISDLWRDGEPERGFSMAMDSLRNEALADTVVVMAHDDQGVARGFLHFVPAAGRRAWSLSAMRRERDTPNGLIDFLVVEAIFAAREREVSELSLNFAAFARWLHSPSGPVERVLAHVVRFGDRFFQVESLLSFNAKFQPRWQPRYLLFDGALGLPRAALAAMWAEGQLPKPAVPRLARSPEPEPELEPEPEPARARVAIGPV